MVAAEKKHAVLRQLGVAFDAITKPERVALTGPTHDQQRQQIESQFGRRSRDDLTYEDVAMMLVDGPLIEPAAFWYFLPRLAKSVFFEGAAVFMLLQRLKNVDKMRLSPDQSNAVAMLLATLEEMERELDAAE